MGIATARAKPLTAFDEWMRHGVGNAMCRAAARVASDKEKKRIWDSLPEVAGLPPWGKLLELKKQDIEMSPLP